MRYVSLIAKLVLLVTLPLLPVACGGGGGGRPAGPTLSSITVSPANTTVTAGGTQQFTATGTFSDSSTQDLTSQVTWSASSGVVIIASGTGLATAGNTSGVSTVTATLGAVAGSTLITVTGGTGAGANVMRVAVNGSLCSDATSGGYFNKPCVAVTICNPDNSVCRTVSDILLDTGSYGLRIFRQAIPGLSLPQVAAGSGALAECIQFADQSTIWGPVQLANVQLGAEQPVTVPVQVIDAGFATPTSCGTPDSTPAIAGYTGILGVGPLAEDCGPSCANSARSGVYFSCVGSSCSGTAVGLTNQVRNPVVSLPQDRNGVVVQLPGVSLGGLASLDGSLLLGIGTGTNNAPSGVTTFPTDQAGEFTTIFNGVQNLAFVDTGSNALYFPSSLPLCSNDPNDVFSNWYCPPSTLTLSATDVGINGTPTLPVTFNIGNFRGLFTSTNNSVYVEVGGPSNFGFDWGLPFFMGRNVYIGISGQSSSLGTGPYVAF
ncbi:Gly/Ala/Ser-rich lipoprotein [Geomonas silvestris]|uniref:Gly/Ala/Ser-rich lipoprotein n=1 Tax=Geomonas silvestris TaxID=2740184 RepID=A0A6V8MJ23_9BACT|nr:DUF3443 family protein [Geomonas silvestris]GFO59956.1 Gly/Ala/Ser-rich lipoprotein [Geomonas silvestris]